MRRQFFMLLMLSLTGCNKASTPQVATASLTPQSALDCSTQTAGVLDSKAVKSITIDNQFATETGQVSTGKQVGYSFKGKAGQTFDSQTADRICIQIYTPDNKLLTNTKDLPKDGTYIAQISVPQGSTSFSLKMSLASTSQSTLGALPISTPSPSTSPKASKSPASSTRQTNSGDKSQDLDNMADKLFYEKYPQLAGTKVQSGTSLGNEWAQIRQCDAIVDYTFQQRHPELNGRNIQGGESALQSEWWNIHSGVEGC